MSTFSSIVKASKSCQYLRPDQSNLGKQVMEQKLSRKLMIDYQSKWRGVQNLLVKAKIWSPIQCYQIGRFFALWATIESRWQQLFTQIGHIVR